MAPSPGYGWRSQRGWAPAVRPGLKPRAESQSPLKGAVRRPGARVDRLGAGAVGISRLQPAWRLSPAVHGRAIVERAARLICAACRARRVGHAGSPRPWRWRARQRLAPTGVGCRITDRGFGRHDPVVPCRPVGIRRCLTRRPGRAGNHRMGRWAWCRVDGRRGRCMPRVFAAPVARAGEAAPRPYRGGVPHHRLGIWAP
jgi:hypothetical protein